MSAFFVSRQTIHDVVCAITRLAPTPRSTDTMNAMGRALWAMNAEALRQRYPSIIGTNEDRENAGEAAAYCFFPPRDLSLAQAAKSIHCLAYQCSEGNVPESALFKMLDQVGNVLGEPAGYDAAEWDRYSEVTA